MTPSDTEGHWDLRVIEEKWGVIGPRMLRGDADYPDVYKGLTIAEAMRARETWEKYLNSRKETRTRKR